MKTDCIGCVVYHRSNTICNSRKILFNIHNLGKQWRSMYGQSKNCNAELDTYVSARWRRNCIKQIPVSNTKKTRKSVSVSCSSGDLRNNNKRDSSRGLKTWDCDWDISWEAEIPAAKIRQSDRAADLGWPWRPVLLTFSWLTFSRRR